MASSSDRRPRVAVVSDYLDFYDFAFASPHFPHDITWNRFSRDNVKRRDQLNALDESGFKTPRHGLVRALLPQLAADARASGFVVVYIDELAHCGENKIKLPYVAAMEWPDHYCSEFIPPWGGQPGEAVSFRSLRIGARHWILRYTGKNSWMSNNADEVTVEILSEMKRTNEGKAARSKQLKPCSNLLNLPMLAVDFVRSEDGTMYFIDINSAPGLKGSGVDDILTPTEIYDLVVEHYVRAE